MSVRAAGLEPRARGLPDGQPPPGQGGPEGGGPPRPSPHPLGLLPASVSPGGPTHLLLFCCPFSGSDPQGNVPNSPLGTFSKQVPTCGGGSQRLALRLLTTAMAQPCPARAAQATLCAQSLARGLDTIGAQSAFGEGMNEQKNNCQRQAQHCPKYSTNTSKFFTLNPCKHPTKWV